MTIMHRGYPVEFCGELPDLTDLEVGVGQDSRKQLVLEREGGWDHCLRAAPPMLTARAKMNNPRPITARIRDVF